MQIAQAVFLVGGRGTRLGDLTRETPKPLLPVAGRPFVGWLMDEVARHGVSEILLVAAHHGDQLRARFDGHRVRDATVRVLVEEAPTGTGGAIRFAEPHLAPTFLLLNGDSLFDVNLLDLSTSLSAGLAHLALRRVSPGSRYGRVRLEGDRITAFEPPGPGGGPINGGVYVARRTLAERIGPGVVSLENDVFPTLAAAGDLGGRLYDGFFLDIGVPEDFTRAQTEVPRRLRRPAAFLDRDGVLNHDSGYPHRPRDIVWTPGVFSAIKRLNDLGWFVFVVTNQAGVAHGMYAEDAVVDLHRWMSEQMAAHGAHVDAFKYCPDHPRAVVPAYCRESPRRKPMPGMLLELLSEWPVDPDRSFLVGDRQTDLAAAAAAGIRGHLFDGEDLSRFLETRVPDWLSPALDPPVP